MHKTTVAFIVGSFLPAAMAHIGMWHPSVYGFNGNGYSIVEPLANLDFNRWWFHGEKNNGPKDGAKLKLPAGGEVTIELACNKRFTSFGGDGNGNNPCPSDNPSMHAGTPIKDSQLRGCGLAIAYKDNVDAVNPEDFTIFSVNHECVKYKNTVFKVPQGMPKCPGGKCICAWFWQGQESANEMYMNGFDCEITNPGNNVLSTPKPPTECRTDGCTEGAKQPMYWAGNKLKDGKESNIKFSGEYERKPAYNEAWGFKNGAQEDIFEEGAQQSPEAEQGQPGELPEQEAPEGCPKPATVTVTEAAVTVTVTVSKRRRPTPDARL